MARLKFVFLYMAFFHPGCNAPFAQPLLIYRNSTGKTIPIKTRATWTTRRIQILDSMQAAMGKLPYENSAGVPAMKVLDSLRETNFTRFTLELTVGHDENVSVYLYMPHASKNEQKYPAVLALHETDLIGKRSVDGQGKNKNLAYAREMAQRGYVVIAPDYPGFGDSKDYDFKSDRYQSGTMKGIFNHMRCIDFLQSLKEVDPDRLGVIGHSLGGHNAMFVAAFDSRLKVTVSSCGWTLFDFYDIGQEAARRYGGRLGPYAQERYMPLLRDKYKLEDDKIPFDFDEIIAAIAPRAFFSNSPLKDGNFNVKGVQKGIEHADAVFRLLAAGDKIQVRYPDSQHDFPQDVRFEAYTFIDKILKKK